MHLYGLIGYPLTHSFSQRYFTEKFKREGLNDYSYDNFQMENIREVKKILQSKSELRGLNVTIPHKKNIIDHLDDCNDLVRKINACNCIKIINNKWVGYNTDVIAFEKSFTVKLNSTHTKALVLGTGGASKAVEYVLQKLKIDYLLVSSSKSGKGIIKYNSIDNDLLNDYTIVINTTPVGTFPNIDKLPQIPYDQVSEKHYFFDLIYNPDKTLFLKKAEEKGALIQNGYDMLVTQAEESWNIWKND